MNVRQLTTEKLIESRPNYMIVFDFAVAAAAVSVPFIFPFWKTFLAFSASFFISEMHAHSKNILDYDASYRIAKHGTQHGMA